MKLDAKSQRNVSPKTIKTKRRLACALGSAPESCEKLELNQFLRQI